jgi:hypothetical protein
MRGRSEAEDLYSMSRSVPIVHPEIPRIDKKVSQLSWRGFAGRKLIIVFGIDRKQKLRSDDNFPFVMEYSIFNEHLIDFCLEFFFEDLFPARQRFGFNRRCSSR